MNVLFEFYFLLLKLIIFTVLLNLVLPLIHYAVRAPISNSFCCKGLENDVFRNTTYEQLLYLRECSGVETRLLIVINVEKMFQIYLIN